MFLCNYHYDLRERREPNATLGRRIIRKSITPYWTEVKMKIKEKIKTTTKIVIQVTGRSVEEKNVAYQFLIVFFLI